jgi:GT2 family glycosyltransferase
MKPNAICRQIILDRPQGPDDALILNGLYRATAIEKTEIELLEVSRSARSVIYAGHDDLFVFIPHGSYRFWSRALNGGAVSAQLHRLAFAARLALTSRKVMRLARRGPGALISAGRAWLEARRHKGQVLATRLSDGAMRPPANTVVRDILTPVPVPEDLRAVSIVIPTKEHVELLSACIASLRLVRDISIDIIVVDNGAERPAMVRYLADIGEHDGIQVVRLDIPFNFSRLCNYGARFARHPFLCFLNDDIEGLDGEWLGVMLGYAARPDAGVVGARLLYPSGDLQHAGIASNLIPGPGHPWLGTPRQEWERNPFVMTSGEVDAVTAACLLIQTRLFGEVGGFDEQAFAITINDVDLCLKVKALGLKTVYAAEATLVHKEGQTRRADDRPDQVARRNAELRAYCERYPLASRFSVFYPQELRRDTALGVPA